MTLKDSTCQYSPFNQQTKTALALWHEMLADFDIQTVKFAVHKEYPPTIGQLIESIIVVSGHAAPDGIIHFPPMFVF